MSDASKPENEQIRTEQMPNPNFVVRHSDDGVVEEFDKTNLEDAPLLSLADHGIMTKEELDARHSETSRFYKEKKSRGKIVAIAGGAAALLATTVFLLGGGSGEDDAKISATPTTEEETPDTTGQTATTDTSGTSENTGNPIETSERPVFLLPTGNDPQKVLDALIYNQDCYVSFGDQECIDNAVFGLNGDPLNTELGRDLTSIYESYSTQREIVDYFERVQLATVIDSEGFDDPDAPERTIRYSAYVVDGTFGQYEATITLAPRVDSTYTPETRWLITYADIGVVRTVDSSEIPHEIFRPERTQ